MDTATTGVQDTSCRYSTAFNSDNIVFTKRCADEFCERQQRAAYRNCHGADTRSRWARGAKQSATMRTDDSVRESFWLHP